MYAQTLNVSIFSANFFEDFSALEAGVTSHVQEGKQ